MSLVPSMLGMFSTETILEALQPLSSVNSIVVLWFKPEVVPVTVSEFPEAEIVTTPDGLTVHAVPEEAVEVLDNIISSLGLTEDGPEIVGFGFTIKSFVDVLLQLFVVPTTVRVCVPEVDGVKVELAIGSPLASFQV